MKTKTENLLPKMLRGTVHAQFKRCGKPNCKCATGELHGAYFYHFVRNADGKLQKRYLRPDEVEHIRQACAARQRSQRDLREQLRENRLRWREMLDGLRELKRNGSF